MVSKTKELRKKKTWFHDLDIFIEKELNKCESIHQLFSKSSYFRSNYKTLYSFLVQIQNEQSYDLDILWDDNLIKLLLKFQHVTKEIELYNEFITYTCFLIHFGLNQGYIEQGFRYYTWSKFCSSGRNVFRNPSYKKMEHLNFFSEFNSLLLKNSFLFNKMNDSDSRDIYNDFIEEHKVIYFETVDILTIILFLEYNKREFKHILAKKIGDYKIILDAYDKKILDKILSQYNETKDEIILNTLTPLVGKPEFFALVIKNKIPFQAINNPEFSKELSSSLIKLSDIKGFGLPGNPNITEVSSIPADNLAKKVGPLLDESHEQGIITLQAKADFLNQKEIKTLRGKKWERISIKRTWERWQKLKAEEESNKIPSRKTPKPE